MMILRRGEHVVIGFTDDSFATLQSDGVLQIDGASLGAPGRLIYFVHFKNDEEMRATLQRNGYHLPPMADGDD